MPRKRNGSQRVTSASHASTGSSMGSTFATSSSTPSQSMTLPSLPAPIIAPSQPPMGWICGWKRSVPQPTKRPTNEDELIARNQELVGGRGPSKCHIAEKAAAARGNMKLLEWDRQTKAPKEPDRKDLATAMGVWTRAECPMLYDEFSDAPPTVLDSLLTHLSVFYEINREDANLMTWFKHQLNSAYKRWKSKCADEYRYNGRDPPYPVEFRHRMDQWEWLMNHFDTPEFQAKSDHFTDLRGSTNKINHTGGAKPFATHAQEKIKHGTKGAHMSVAAELYKKNALEKSEEIENKRLKLMEGIPTDSTPTQPEGANDSVTSPEIAQPQDDIPFEAQVAALSETLGVAKGTYVRGMGGLRREPQKRGPTRQDGSSSSRTGGSTNEELVHQVAELSAKLSSTEETLATIQAYLQTLPGFRGFPTLNPNPSSGS